MPVLIFLLKTSSTGYHENDNGDIDDLLLERNP